MLKCLFSLRVEKRVKREREGEANRTTAPPTL